MNVISPTSAGTNSHHDLNVRPKSHIKTFSMPKGTSSTSDKLSLQQLSHHGAKTQLETISMASSTKQTVTSKTVGFQGKNSGMLLP